MNHNSSNSFLNDSLKGLADKPIKQDEKIEKHSVIYSHGLRLSSTRKRLQHAHKHHQEHLEKTQKNEENLQEDLKKDELQNISKSQSQIHSHISSKNHSESRSENLQNSKKHTPNTSHHHSKDNSQNHAKKHKSDKHIWDVVLTVGLTACFIMAGFLGFQNQNLHVEQNKIYSAIKKMDLSDKIVKESEKTVYIRRKIEAKNMQTISQNLQKRTADFELKSLLETNQAGDFWETLGQGIVVDENFVVVPKQLAIGGGNFEAKRGNQKEAEIKKLSLVAVHPFEDLALFKTDSAFLNSDLKLENNQILGERVYLKSPTNLAEKSFSVGNISLKEANLDAIFSSSIQESLAPKPLQQAINKQNNTNLYKKAFAQSSLSHGSSFIYTAPVLILPIGSPIFNQNGDFLGMHNSSLQRPDTTVFVAKDTIDFNSDLGEQNIKDVALEGVALGSSFQFNLAISSKAITQMVDSYKNSVGLASLPINGRELNPALASFIGINEDYGFIVNSISADEKNYPIKKNDILLEINQEKISQKNSFGQLLANKKIGDEIEIKLLRKTENLWKEESVFVKIIERKMQSAEEFLQLLKS